MCDCGICLGSSHGPSQSLDSVRVWEVSSIAHSADDELLRLLNDGEHI